MNFYAGFAFSEVFGMIYFDLRDQALKCISFVINIGKDYISVSEILII